MHIACRIFAYSRFWEVQRSANYCLLYRHWMNEAALFPAVLCVYVQLREREDGEGIAATAQSRAALAASPAPVLAPLCKSCAGCAFAGTLLLHSRNPSGLVALEPLLTFSHFPGDETALQP